MADEFVTMKTIPRGWTRGDGIVVHTAPSPWLKDRDLVVVMLQQERVQYSDPSLRFTDVEPFELWRRWWFDVPKPPFPLDLSQEAAKQFTQDQWAKLKPAPAPAPVPVIPRVDPFVKPKNPFAQPVNNSVKNPFESKPKNPFDKA